VRGEASALLCGSSGLVESPVLCKHNRCSKTTRQWQKKLSLRLSMTMNPFASRRQRSWGHADSLPGVLRRLKNFCSRPNSAKRPASFLMFTCRASAVSSCRAAWCPHIVERLSSLLPVFGILESRSGHSRAGPSAFSRSPSTERPSFNVSIAPLTSPTVERISRGRSGESSATLSKLAQFHMNCSNN